MRAKYIPRVGRMIATIAYCGEYTAAGLEDRAALLIHIPGVKKSDFMRRCAMWHLAMSIR